MFTNYDYMVLNVYVIEYVQRDSELSIKFTRRYQFSDFFRLNQVTRSLELLLFNTIVYLSLLLLTESDEPDCIVL